MNNIIYSLLSQYKQLSLYILLLLDAFHVIKIIKNETDSNASRALIRSSIITLLNYACMQTDRFIN